MIKSLCQIALALLFLTSLGCGSISKGDGLLVQTLDCLAQSKAEVEEPDEGFSHLQYKYLPGTGGGYPSVAQRLDVSPARRRIYGLALALSGHQLPEKSLKVEILHDNGGFPGADMKAGKNWITPQSLGSAPQWVYVALEEIIYLEAGSTYWIGITPRYESSETMAAWMVQYGSGLATKSAEQWSVATDQAAVFQVLECGT